MAEQDIVARSAGEPGTGRLQLAAGARVLSLPDGDVAVVNDHLQLRLSGTFGGFFRERLVPLLDGTRTRDEVLAAANVDRDELDAWLSRLDDAGVVDWVVAPSAGVLPQTTEHFLRALRLSQRADAHIRQLHVAIVGLDALGAELAWSLARFGVGRLTLADAEAVTDRDRSLLPHGLDAEGPREAAVRDWLASLQPEPNVDVAGPVASRDELSEALTGADLIVHIGAAPPAGSAHWVNQIALRYSTRALFARVEATTGVVGPLVLPGEGPCYLCWRMRAVATNDDYDIGMCAEEDAAAGVTPLADRALFTPMVPMTAALATTEALKVLVGFGTPSTAANVWEIDGLTLATSSRPVLQRPDCPACRKKDLRPPRQPSLDRLAGAVGSPPAAASDTNLARAAERLVDARTGLVRSLRAVPRDPSEPPLPLVYRAELANHRLVPADHEPFTVASGKGMSSAAAMTSALGEALERYGAHHWHPKRLTHARIGELDGDVISPPRLVLYEPDQYDALRYAPWSETTVMDWVRARDLTTGAEPYVPALGTYLDYEVSTRDEFLFTPTSSGLAAGPSLPAAIERALLELLERDAFLLAWLHRLPVARIDPATVPDADVRELANAYERRGVELITARLPTEHGVHVVVAIGHDHRAGADRPVVVVGLGADTALPAAVRRATLEVGQVRPALRARLRDPAVQERLDELERDPWKVDDLEDHDLLYAAASQRFRLAGWLEAAVESFNEVARRHPDPDPGLDTLVRRLAAVDLSVLYVDLTPADVAGFGVHVARVHAPGLQPIHFGAYETRLANPRLYEYPARLGIGSAATRDELELAPHPLA